MTINLLIAPDFAPERFAGWHIAKYTATKIWHSHSFTDTRVCLTNKTTNQAQNVDIIYANPFDAATMIPGSRAIARWRVHWANLMKW